MGPELMLASPSKLPAAEIARMEASGLWWFELKFDGIRAAVVRGTDGAVTIYNRRQADITYRYPDVVAAVEEHAFVGTLDGEIIVAGEHGRPDFAAAHRRDAQRSPGAARRLSALMPATFVPFDVLELEGQDVRPLSYEMRRQRLARAWGTEGMSLSSQEGSAMWEFVLASDLEGLVAKLATSRYRPGQRHSSWVKLKATKRLHALVTGVTPGKGSRGAIGALTLALWDPQTKELVPIGRVGSGMRDADLRIITDRLEAGSPLVVEVEYLEVARSGQLRMPVFKGLSDALPEACTVDQL